MIRDINELLDILGVNDPDYKPPTVWNLQGSEWIERRPASSPENVEEPT